MKTRSSRDRFPLASQDGPAGRVDESESWPVVRQSIDTGLDFRALVAVWDDEFEQMEIAEDCIRLAQRRHGEAPVIRDKSGRVISEKGLLWRSFLLLRPTHPLLRKTEWLYRDHCREILERVTRGADTRPGTGVEVMLALMETSLRVPLNGAACGLYFRLLFRQFPDRAREIFRDFPRGVDDYEVMYGSGMDDLENYARRRLHQKWRRPPRKESAPSQPEAATRRVSGST